MKAGLLCLALCLSGSATAAERAGTPEVVTVGVFLMAPFVMEGPAGPHGAVIEFFDKEIAPRMGVTFKWERPMTTARLEQSLISGRVMFTPVLSRNAERARAGIRYAGGCTFRLRLAWRCWTSTGSRPSSGRRTWPT